MDQDLLHKLVRKTAHDVRTPITTIAGFADLLAEDKGLSESSRDIAATILTETLGRSATVIDSHGHFTKQKNDMLYMIVDKRQLAPLKQIVEAADPRAFVVIHKVREVIGEGFTYPSR